MGLYQYDSTEDKLNLVAGSTNFSDAPVGAIFPFGGTDIPISFLLCDGSAVSRTDYEDLFNVIGTAFGTGDGSTTFNLPDLREAVPKGAGLTSHTVGNHVKTNGLAVGEFIDDRVQEHQHTMWFNRPSSGSYAGITDVAGGTQIEYGDSHTGRSGATTEVKSVGVNYIIKAKQVGMPADFASAVGDIVVDKNTYSTSETIVGKWIDGKPIYRKVFSGLSISTANTGETFVNTNCAIPTDAETLIYEGCYGSNSNTNLYEFHFSSANASFDSNTGKLTVWTGRNAGTIKRIVIEYTKTTD